MRILEGVIVLGLLMGLPGCAPPEDGQANEGSGDESLVQFSLIAALAADHYEGVVPLADVLESGDFGLGTFDRLDGEMIVLDGGVYQALSDGTVRKADPAATTPFAAVTRFAADGRIDDFSAASLDDLNEQLDRKLPRPNSPYAIRATGKFAELTLRSVPAQTPPYRPLVEVVKEQVTWQHREVRGTLIGLRCPAWMGTINVSGYHWHFLSEDHEIGGHVLDCQFQRAAVSFDECTSVVIHVPSLAKFDSFDADEVGEEDIDRIERLRAVDRRQ